MEQDQGKTVHIDTHLHNRLRHRALDLNISLRQYICDLLVEGLQKPVKKKKEEQK